MKNLIIFIILFFASSAKSQSLEKIENQNTFFILFDNKNSLSKYGCGNRGKSEKCSYHFYKTNKEEFEFHFYYSTYPTFDDEYNTLNKSMLFKVNKSFIKKNKDIIITRNFMEKMGQETMLRLLYDNRSNKIIFLINTADTNNGKLLVRQVTINYIAEE